MPRLYRIAALTVAWLVLSAGLTLAQPAATHTVKRGDTLFRIAQAYNLTLEQLRQLNRLASDQIQAGQVLIVSVPPADGASPEDAPAAYTVRPEDTLPRIAARFGLRIEDVQRWNDLPGTTLGIGQRLWLRPPADPTQPPPPDTDQAPQSPSINDILIDDDLENAATDDAPNHSERISAEDGYAGYTVQPGDTFYGIALRFSIPIDTLLRLNPDAGTVLRTGRRLSLPAAYATVAYRVRSGETLSGISQRFGVRVTALKAANGLTSDQIGVGQVLQIPSAQAQPVYAAPERPSVAATGAVLVYPETFAGRLTAGGTPYDPERYTVSHPALPLGTLVLLTSPSTGRSTFAEVTDRGPIDTRYLMEVSAAVAQALGLPTQPTVPADASADPLAAAPVVDVRIFP